MSQQHHDNNDTSSTTTQIFPEDSISNHPGLSDAYDYTNRNIYISNMRSGSTPGSPRGSSEGSSSSKRPRLLKVNTSSRLRRIGSKGDTTASSSTATTSSSGEASYSSRHRHPKATSYHSSSSSSNGRSSRFFFSAAANRLKSASAAKLSRSGSGSRHRSRRSSHHKYAHHSRRNSATSILNLVPQKQVTDFQSKQQEEQAVRSFCGLFFVNRNVESKFLKFYYGRNLIRFRIVLIFVCIFWIIFLYGDITKDIKEQREWAYYTNIVLRMVPLMVSFFSFIILLLPNVFRRSWAVELLAGITVSSFSVCICAMAAFAHVPPNYINYPIGTMLVLIVVYTLPRLRMLTMGVNAAISLLVYIIAHVAANTSHFYTDSARIFIFILAIGFTHIVGMSQSYWVEAFFRRVFTLQQEIYFRKKSVMSEKDVTHKLLQNILPAELVPRVQAAPQERFVQKYASMSAIQSDLKNFTKVSSTISASALVNMLNAQFTAFDAIGKANDIQRSKTVGDAWLGYGVSGNHRQNAFRAALFMIHALKRLNTRHGWGFDIRIGVATGSGLLVVFGINYLTFDCYGDSVSLASKLESSGIANHVHIDDCIYSSLAPIMRSYLHIEEKNLNSTSFDRPTYIVKVPDNLPELMESIEEDIENERSSSLEDHVASHYGSAFQTPIAADDSATIESTNKLSSSANSTAGNGSVMTVGLNSGIGEETFEEGDIPSGGGESNDESSFPSNKKSSTSPNGSLSNESTPTTPRRKRSSSLPSWAHKKRSSLTSSNPPPPSSLTKPQPAYLTSQEPETTLLKTQYESYRKHSSNRFVGLQKLPALDEKAVDDNAASLLADFKGTYSFNPVLLFFYNIHTHIQFMKDSYINMTGVVGSFLFLVVLVEIFFTCGLLAMFVEEAGSPTLILYYLLTALTTLLAVIYVFPCISRFIAMGILFTYVSIISFGTFMPLLFALPVNVVNEFLPALSFWFILIVSLSTIIPVAGQVLIMIMVLLFNAIFLLILPQYRDLSSMAVLSCCAAMQMIASYGLGRSIARAFVLRKQAKYALVRVKRERDINNSLLQSCLPRHVLERIKKNPSAKIHDSEYGAILFAEVLGFNEKMSTHPVETVQLVNDIFSLFDNIIDRRNCVKIKSIGSIYIAVAIGKRSTVECDRMAKCGIFMLKAMQEILSSHEYSLDTSNMGLRVGCNYGNFTAAIVGHSKLLYDVWSDSINQTSRFCTSGRKNEIRCSQVFYEAIRDLNYDFECLGPVFLKGKGEKILYRILLDGVVTPSTPTKLGRSHTASSLFSLSRSSSSSSRSGRAREKKSGRRKDGSGAHHHRASRRALGSYATSTPSGLDSSDSGSVSGDSSSMRRSASSSGMTKKQHSSPKNRDTNHAPLFSPRKLKIKPLKSLKMNDPSVLEGDGAAQKTNPKKEKRLNSYRVGYSIRDSLVD